MVTSVGASAGAPHFQDGCLTPPVIAVLYTGPNCLEAVPESFNTTTMTPPVRKTSLFEVDILCHYEAFNCTLCVVFWCG
jgi:hypothetical protein